MKPVERSNQPAHFSRNQMMPQHKEMTKHHVEEMKEFCRQNRYGYVILEMDDGQYYDGVMMDIDQEHIHLLIPIGDEQQTSYQEDYDNYNNNRQFGYGPYFGRVPFRFRRFHPFLFPFLGIRRFFFPFFY